MVALGRQVRKKEMGSGGGCGYPALDVASRGSQRPLLLSGSSPCSPGSLLLASSDAGILGGGRQHHGEGEVDEDDDLE